MLIKLKYETFNNLPNILLAGGLKFPYFWERGSGMCEKLLGTNYLTVLYLKPTQSFYLVRISSSSEHVLYISITNVEIWN